MTYIPTSTSGTRSTQNASRRALDLSERISQVIVDYQRSFPDTRPADVQHAMRLAWGSTLDTNRQRRVVITLLIGLFLFLFTLGLFVLGA
jgi:hypothetical protein